MYPALVVCRQFHATLSHCRLMTTEQAVVLLQRVVRRYFSDARVVMFGVEAVHPHAACLQERV